MSETSNICPQCGSKYDESRRFCEEDGSQLITDAEATTMLRAADASTAVATAPTDEAPVTHPAKDIKKRLNISRETMAGFIIVAAVAILVGGLFSWRQSRVLRLEITFDEGHDLKTGDSVYVRGADVGEVSNTSFQDGQFVASILVDADNADQIRKGSAFFIAMDKAFVNKKCVQIFVTNPKAEPVASGSTIRGEDSMVKYVSTLVSHKGKDEAARFMHEFKEIIKFKPKFLP